MSVDLIFKIAGIGIMISIFNMILTKAGREDIATIVSIVGLIVCLFLTIDLIAILISTIKEVFMF